MNRYLPVNASCLPSFRAARARLRLSAPDRRGLAGLWVLFALAVGLAACDSSTTPVPLPPAGPSGPPWATLTPMPAGLESHKAATVNGKIYVFGGFDNAFGSPTTVYEYDPASDQWTNCGGTCAPMSAGRGDFAIAAVNGKIYLIGGWVSTPLDLVEEYDPTTNAWTNCGGTCSAMPTARKAAVAAVSGGMVYVLGGGTLAGTLDVVEAYNPVSNRWLNCGGTCAIMPTARQDMAAQEANGKITVVSGWSAADPELTVEEYDVAGDAWSNCGGTCPDTGHQRIGSGSGIVAGNLYVFGGFDGASYSVPAVEAYDTVTATWSNCGGACTVNPLPTYHPASVTVGGTIYLIGGYDGTTRGGDTLAYTPANE